MNNQSQNSSNRQNQINFNEQNKKIIEKLTKKMQIINKESNLDADLFLVPTISDYKCLICEYIPNPETAYEAICCGIIFCKECLIRWISEKPKCPICKNQLKNESNYVRSIKDNNKLFYKTLKKFNIKCPNGCEWKGEWGNLDNHLIDCEKGLKECKYKDIGCEFIGEKEKIKEHEQNDKIHLDLAMKFIKENEKNENNKNNKNINNNNNNDNNNPFANPFLRRNNNNNNIYNNNRLFIGNIFERRNNYDLEFA